MMVLIQRDPHRKCREGLRGVPVGVCGHEQIILLEESASSLLIIYVTGTRRR